MEFTQTSANVCRDALAILRQDIAPTVEELNEVDGAHSVLASKCRCFYEAARMEVLSWPGWDFCVERDTVLSHMSQNGEYLSPAPSGYAAIRAVYSESMRPVSWRLNNDMIVSIYPIRYVEYVRNEEDIDRWSPRARKALVYCLARDLAIPVTGRNSDLQMTSQMYEEMKQGARLADAKNSNPGRRAYGNRLSETITGNFPEFDE